MSEVTRILSQVEIGDSSTAEQLLPLVYQELRRLAATRLAQEKPGQTLQATALVHEAYLRLLGSENDCPRWENCGHFFAAAAESMRRILIDQARHKQCSRSGGSIQRHDVCQLELATSESGIDLLRLDEALERFSERDPEKAQLVKLRYFAGLTIPEAAQALGISSTTADRHWAYARAWLHTELSRER